MLSSPTAALALKFLFTALALVAAFRVAAWDARGADSMHGAGGALLGALLGAKVGFWIQYPGVWHGDDSSLWMALSGLSVAGACAGGALGLVLASPKQAGALAEAWLAPVLVFLLVLDLGSVTWHLTEPGFGAAAGRWGINFGDGMLRHPVMLYDAAALATLWWAASRAHCAGLAPGLRAAVAGAGCFGLWFLLAFLKPPFGPRLMLESLYPVPRLYPPGWTGEQWICLLALGALGASTAWRAARLPQRE